MSNLKEDGNGNKPIQKNYFETELMDINPDEYMNDHKEIESSQMPGSTSVEPKSESVDIETEVSGTAKKPKREIGGPSCSKDQSNIRLTWESKDLTDRRNHDTVKSVSMNAVLNISYDKVMEGVKAYFERKPDSKTNPTSTLGTQTPPLPLVTRFSLQYRCPSDDDDDDYSD